MQLVNEFESDVPADELFELLTDIERVAPCLPGAVLSGREGDAWLGSLRVKIGPVMMDFEGRLKQVEADRSQRRAVLHASAADTRGSGAAEAHVNSKVEEVGSASRVTIETDLQLRGRAAQFGRGAIDKIAAGMFDEFARNLDQVARGGVIAGAATGNGAASPGSGVKAAPTQTDYLDLTPSVPAAVPWVAGIVLAFLAGLLYGYRSGELRALRRELRG